MIHIFFHKEKLYFSVLILSDSESHKNRLLCMCKFLQQIQTILNPGWIYLSSSEVSSKIPFTLMAEGKEEFNPTFDCQWKEPAPSVHVLMYPAQQRMPRQHCWATTRATAAFKHGLGLIFLWRKGRKTKEEYLEYSVLRCLEYSTI